MMEARRPSTTMPSPSSNRVTKQRQKFSESVRGQMHHEVVTMRDRQEIKEGYPKLLICIKRSHDCRPEAVVPPTTSYFIAGVLQLRSCLSVLYLLHNPQMARLQALATTVNDDRGAPVWLQFSKFYSKRTSGRMRMRTECLIQRIHRILKDTLLFMLHQKMGVDKHIEDLLDISDLAVKTDLLCATALHMAAIHACDGLEYATQRHSRTETNLSSCSSKSI
ncbi:hypothetical protein HID58_086038 [Brassica napus]|uniref:Uncharacterized protein n=1 Tax=Brassica napus TaxID=3708 RepID=A0ABQ7XPC3_BRANA|nr:hypothetical protein HID58_086038 [Brassica napus]